MNVALDGPSSDYLLTCRVIYNEGVTISYISILKLSPLTSYVSSYKYDTTDREHLSLHDAGVGGKYDTKDWHTSNVSILLRGGVVKKSSKYL